MNRYYQLTREQRYQISALKETGLKQKEIAAQLGVDPSTISRELRRKDHQSAYFFQVGFRLWGCSPGKNKRVKPRHTLIHANHLPA